MKIIKHWKEIIKKVAKASAAAEQILLLTLRNCVTVVSTTIKGRCIKCTTPFFTGIFALTISASTTPVECFESPRIVFDFTYTEKGMKNENQ